MEQAEDALSDLLLAIEEPCYCGDAGARECPFCDGVDAAVRKVRKRVRALREDRARLREVLDNISEHVQDCREGYIPASDLVRELYWELLDCPFVAQDWADEDF